MQGVRLARRQVDKEVTLWPLVAESSAVSPLEVWPVETALEDGFLSVASLSRETSEGAAGAAPAEAVRVTNRAALPVVLLAGEPLGGAGVAAESRLIPPHCAVSLSLAAASSERPCPHCVEALVAAFRPEEGQVGFVLSLHDRAIALEVVSPGWLCERRLERRLAAWAPWLLAQAGRDAWEHEDSGPGFAPEDLLRAVAASGGGPFHRVLTSPELRGPWKA